MTLNLNFRSIELLRGSVFAIALVLERGAMLLGNLYRPEMMFGFDLFSRGAAGTSLATGPRNPLLLHP